MTNNSLLKENILVFPNFGEYIRLNFSFVLNASRENTHSNPFMKRNVIILYSLIKKNTHVVLKTINILLVEKLMEYPGNVIVSVSPYT